MADTKVFLSGNRIQGRSDDSVTTPDAVAQTSWKQIAKTTLGSGATAITVTGIPQKDNLMVLVSTLDEDASLFMNFGINDGSASTDTDDSGKWSWSGCYLGDASERTGVDQVKLKINDQQDGSGAFGVISIKNITDKQKFTTSRLVEYNGTTDYPRPQDWVGKFNRTDGYIDRIELTSQLATGDGSITFPAGSEVVVLGCDDDEADSGTVFWEELTDYAITSSASMDTGASSIAEKKYLMIMIFINDPSGTASGGSGFDAQMRFNNDSGTKYMYRFKNGNRTSLAQGTGSAQLYGLGSHQGGDKQIHAFFANISGKPKLGIFAASQGSSAGSAGPRKRGAWKYSPDSLTDFISRIQIIGTSGTDSTIRVWGGTPT